MKTIYANDVGLIKLGYQSENDRTEVIFDVSDIAAEFPGGLISVAVRRPTDNAGHLVTSITQNGSTARWLVDDYELEHRGIGELQLIYSVTNVVAKTKIWKIVIDCSLTVADSLPPDWQDVANTLLTAASQVKAAVDSYDAMTAEAETLDPDAEATAVIDRSGENPVLKLGIPKGHDATVSNVPVESGTAIGSVKTKDFEYNGTAYSNTASGRASFAEGMGTQATGNSGAHAEGTNTTAAGNASHAEGEGTYAQGLNQHTQGKYNAVDTGNGVFADIVGNGSDNAHRSNAYALDWDGDGHYAGDVYVHANPDSTGGLKLATLDDLPEVPVQDVQVSGVSVLQNGVANVPIASNANFGVVKVQPYNGLRINASNWLETAEAETKEVKTGQAHFKPIAPVRQHESTFYGLAKAAGHDEKNSTLPVGQYTPEAKEAIQSMLGIDEAMFIVPVSGTMVNIEAKGNRCYVCGEVTSIVITPPESGICDIIFTSGTSAAVLATTGVVWPEWFNPEALETETTYELNIFNGRGLACLWPKA